MDGSPIGASLKPPVPLFSPAPPSEEEEEEGKEENQGGMGVNEAA